MMPCHAAFLVYFFFFSFPIFQFLLPLTEEIGPKWNSKPDVTRRLGPEGESEREMGNIWNHVRCMVGVGVGVWDIGWDWLFDIRVLCVMVGRGAGMDVWELHVALGETGWVGGGFA